MRFTFNKKKERDNIRDHDGIDFEHDAKQPFFDDHAYDRTPSMVDGEQRCLVIGESHKGLLAIAYTYAYTDDEEFHIISARRATRRERQIYTGEINESMLIRKTPLPPEVLKKLDWEDKHSDDSRINFSDIPELDPNDEYIPHAEMVKRLRAGRAKPKVRTATEETNMPTSRIRQLLREYNSVHPWSKLAEKEGFKLENESTMAGVAVWEYAHPKTGAKLNLIVGTDKRPKFEMTNRKGKKFQGNTEMLLQGACFQM